MHVFFIIWVIFKRSCLLWKGLHDTCDQFDGKNLVVLNDTLGLC